MNLSRFVPEASANPDAPRPDRWPSWWWSRLQVSANTHRSFGHEAPRTRGWSHLAMAIVWPVLAVGLLGSAATTRGVVGAVVFGLGMQAMFTISAVTHWRRWGVWSTEALFRFDHSGIFLAIGGSVTPFALLALDGWATWLVLGVLILPFLPMAQQQIGWGGIGLLLAGGACYIAGAILLAFQRPRLSPRVFGYHEVWHAMVVIAALLHYLMVRDHILPLG